jgi:hypothetical protein
MRVTQTNLEKLENKTLKWCGHVARMEDKRWPKRIMKWSQEERQRRGRPLVSCAFPVGNVSWILFQEGRSSNFS